MWARVLLFCCVLQDKSFFTFHRVCIICECCYTWVITVFDLPGAAGNSSGHEKPSSCRIHQRKSCTPEVGLNSLKQTAQDKNKVANKATVSASRKSCNHPCSSRWESGQKQQWQSFVTFFKVIKLTKPRTYTKGSRPVCPS